MAEIRRRLLCRKARSGAQAGPVLLALLAAACGEPAANRPAAYVNVRDSAGIQIVENGPLASVDPAWAVVDTTNRLRIGLVDGEEAYLFERITAAIRLSDGRIAVADHGTAEIRFFDVDGHFLYRTGGKGGGPGEYVNFSRFYPLPADSFLVVDWEGGRWHFAGPDGVPGWSREAPRQATSASGVGPRYRLQETYADGTMLVSRAAPDDCPSSPDVPVLCTRWIHLLRVDREGELLADFGVVPAGQQYSERIPSGSIASISHFYGQGRWGVAGMRTWAAVGDRFEFRVHGPDGDLQRIVRVGEPPRPVGNPRFADSPERDASSTAEERRSRSNFYAAMERAPKPLHYPFFDDAVADDAGNLWVRLTTSLSSSLDDGQRWAVIDSTGVLRGTVRTPSIRARGLGSYTVPQFGDDFILFATRDSFQIPVVDLYPLVRQAPDITGDTGDRTDNGS
jgi:hypothetical protein